MFSSTLTEEFKGVRIKLASPSTIMQWSYGEVTKPETINYRTQRPEKEGLFDEKIFGPIKDWECYCGKYKRIRYKGIVCDKCGVEVTKASVRRERMGHIQLAVPVAHIWFLRGVPSRLGLMLDLGVQELEKVVYFASYIITEVDEEARKNMLEQIENELSTKKKEISQRYEELALSARNRLKAEGKDQDADLVAARIDTELNHLNEAKQKEISALEQVRDQAKSELKSIKKMQVISELAYRDLSLKYGPVFKAGIGAESLKTLLEEVDLESLAEELSAQLKNLEGMAAKKALRRLRLAKSLIAAGLRPEWMLVTILPVIPPDLRPMVQLDGGRFAASDLNDLYRRVINRNNRLKKLIEIKSPEVITRNEKRMLQEAVDALIDNSVRHGKEVTASTGQKRKLRSLADLLKGKQGRFRQNLLGKRVDYSGRSVIVVGPNLKLHQCGLPKKMALELFKPFVISKLIAREYAHHVRSANKLIEQGRNEVWDILEEVIQGHYVLLNRAPTLHRLGFQAFQPILIEGKAIQLHPMVCAAFNADFDGDQMAVHVPLTEAAQKEAREIMVSKHNLLKPANGEPVMTASHDVVVGSYYITKIKPGARGEGKVFADREEAILAYNNRYVEIQAAIKVRMPDGEILETSVGRLIFNKILPKELGYRNELFDKKKLQLLVNEAYRILGAEATANLLDDLKRTGFHYMKKSGISWGMNDLHVPSEKPLLMEGADKEVAEAYEQYQEGLLTEDERYSRVIEIWGRVSEQIAKKVALTVEEHSSVDYIFNSGGRGSTSQLTQMAGLKGLVVSPSGQTIELPCRAGFKEGLEVLEYFISTHGSRKGMSDTALKTADAGYLTRRLVDVAQDMVVVQEDCGTKEFIEITREQAQKTNRSFEKLLFGRVLAEEVHGSGGELLLGKNEAIDESMAKTIDNAGVDKIYARSVLKCRLVRGVCKLCYGFDLGFNKMVDLGAAVGIVAAQSIGEPGTQLTMRTFHTGGAASASDITQGLPRVEELFEARNPKGQATIAEVAGQVYLTKSSEREHLIRIQTPDVAKDEYTLPEGISLSVSDGQKVAPDEVLYLDETGTAVRAKNGGIVVVKGQQAFVVHESEEMKEYVVPSSYRLLVKDGDLVALGQPLTEGNLNPEQVLSLQGTEAAQDLILSEVQKVYSSQGAPINDKHIEVIVRQMFSKVKITEGGDSSFLSGETVDLAKLRDVNEQIAERGGQQAKYEQLLMGITKVSLHTDSWLSAASFQETTRVLISAAVSGQTDYLKGLKENVIIGKLIPAGTGFQTAKRAEQIDLELASDTSTSLDEVELSVAED